VVLRLWVLVDDKQPVGTGPRRVLHPSDAGMGGNFHPWVRRYGAPRCCGLGMNFRFLKVHLIALVRFGV
jgi:hypothetical protein